MKIRTSPGTVAGTGPRSPANGVTKSARMAAIPTRTGGGMVIPENTGISMRSPVVRRNTRSQG